MTQQQPVRVTLGIRCIGRQDPHQVELRPSTPEI